MGATVEFCGEEFVAADDRPLTIGRVADVEIDDNPYLHRVFLQLHREHELWWLSNVGSTLTATVADKKGLFQAWLSPGRAHPAGARGVHRVVHRRPDDLRLRHRAHRHPVRLGRDRGRARARGRRRRDHRRPGLDDPRPEAARRRPLRGRSCAARTPGAGQIPSSAAAAERLGWTVTKFNRKLDNVCQKLADAGTRGLHGGPGKLASNRKARLVEHALSTRMVTESDLALLD